MSRNCADFINRCTKVNPKERLGYGGNTLALKTHPWFADFDWDELYTKRMDPPFVPMNRDNFVGSKASEPFGDEDTKEYRKCIKLLNTIEGQSQFDNFFYNIETMTVDNSGDEDDDAEMQDEETKDDREPDNLNKKKSGNCNQQ